MLGVELILRKKEGEVMANYMAHRICVERHPVPSVPISAYLSAPIVTRTK